MTERITIHGGGIVGLCVATELTARGVPVRICEKGEAPGPQACSWWAAGMLAPFCEGESAEEPVVRLGQEAAGWWERHGVKVVRNGSLVVALGRDRRELARFARRTEGHRHVNAQDIADLEPDLGGRFGEALMFDSEAHITPRAALAQLWDGLQARDVEISDDQPSGGRIIDCRGLAAQDQLTDLRGVKGEMVILRSTEVKLHRPVRLLHPRFPLYVVPRGDGVFMLGATQIESGERTRPTVRSTLELLTAAFALHPAFGEAEILEIGVDARPAFADNMPRIRHRGQTIFVNGMFRHGYLLAPAMARQVAEFVCDDIKPEMMDEDHGEW
ncbi:FAD-dependent oxidoreductase [Epibacterium sp. SM1979]|uniref:FAD-dependent oxidoreductase n=1 Tax=Tritonibacter litoralis TaxID=2662264 RepID=A0A843YD65_9RHOB|nr:FAD-dependent oxidoreductase [Tritonibacter litoralis]MQQ06837.1 FAD-dependent oxidoreductase [Tritonibacter litoralis]